MKLFAALLILLVSDVAFARDAMTTAHRTTGYAPLAVHFSAVDRTSCARASSNVTGVTVGHCRNLTTAGTGVLTFNFAGDYITYTPPGGSAGAQVSCATDQLGVRLYGANGVDWVQVDIDTDNTPGSNQTDNLTITQTRDSDVLQPTATWTTGCPDYGKMTYEWSFGDAHAISYTLTNGRNSNRCWGSPVTAHLFTEPGTYTVVLRITDESGTEHEYEQTITVSDQKLSGGVKIVYVDATTGSDSDNGTTPALAKQSFTAAETAIDQDNCMILFKRGETWTAAAEFTADQSDVTIGTYYNSDGTDNPNQPAPVFNSTVGGFGTTFNVANFALDDIKFCSLHVVGPGSGNSAAFSSGTGATASSNVLLYDCKAEQINVGFIRTNTLPQYQFWVACEAEDIGYGGGGNGFYMIVERSAVLGCHVNDTTGGEHCFRCQGHEELVVADCLFEEPNQDKCCLTMRGRAFGTALKANSYSCDLRCTLVTTIQATAYSVAPQNGLSDERIEDYISDGLRCTMTGTGGGGGSGFRARGVTMRNFVFTLDRFLAIGVGQDDDQIGPHPGWVRIQNGVIETSAAASSGNAIRIGTPGASPFDPTNCTVHNVIVRETGAATVALWGVENSDISALSASDGNMFDGNSGYSRYGSLRSLAQTQSDLSRDASSSTGSAVFVGSGNYRLQASSAAIGAGVDSVLPWARLDADGNLRTTDLDAGAYEYGASPPAEPGAPKHLIITTPSGFLNIEVEQ